MPCSCANARPRVHTLRDLHRLFGAERSVRIFKQALDITAAHQLGDDEWLALVLAEVEHGDDVRVGAEATHRLGLAGDALSADLVEAFGLDQREGHVAIEQLIVGQVDALLAALTEQLADLVAAAREGRWRGGSSRARRCWGQCSSSISWRRNKLPGSGSAPPRSRCPRRSRGLCR